MNEEYAGNISHAYPLRCYQQAIQHLPQDALIYGQFRADIHRAMVEGVGALEGKGIPVSPGTPLPPETPEKEQHSKRGFLVSVARELGPVNASSIPLPLLILTGLGVLLALVAAASLGARRRR